MAQIIWAKSALLPNGWADSVEITVDNNGDISRILVNETYQQGERHNVLIAGMPNVHSHAHQRAMSGLGECAGQAAADGSKDSFWTWRKIMYHYLDRIQPEHLFHISSQLYLEMLKSGFTCVGEFQYLHHNCDGSAYQNPAEMSLQCLHAAESVGIGFTALPVLYRFGGFGSVDSIEGQKRFINNAEGFCSIVESLQSASKANFNTSVGIAPHSLRAIDQPLLKSVIDSIGKNNLAAIHIHIAEQTKEVDDCLAWSQQRPVEWLFNHFDVDQQWCLIHATHMTDDETVKMAVSGCVAGLCPTTEANLGDGFFNAEQYFQANGNWAIGSDSHISIDPVEELRWLEYGQRLVSRGRNVLTSSKNKNTGRNLIDGALSGGAMACGRKIGRIAIGYRADLLAINDNHPRLYGRSTDDLLDSWIFSGNENMVDSVYVGGRKVIENGVHANEQSIASNYRQTLDLLKD
jgi:formimidoylglutamate deiminase